MERIATMESPMGPLRIVADGGGIVRIELASGVVESDRSSADDVLARAEDQLGRYFAGELRRFDLPLNPRGTPFQKEVWDLLLEIPYGETASYGDLARRLGKPGASRAVGAANGANPIPIVVPCHRVIGSDGSLTGFGLGMDAKRRLLDLEAGAGGASPLFAPAVHGPGLRAAT